LAAVTAVASGCATGLVNKPPSNVTDTSATINGIVWTTDGGEVSYWVEYGPTSSYGQETAHQTAEVAEDTPHDVSIPLDGLGGADTWHYRLCAKDAQAGTCSRDATLPALLLTKDCSFPPNHAATVSLSGFPPSTTFTLTTRTPGGGGGPGEFTTDADGNYTFGPVASRVAGTWSAEVVWSGGTLTASLFVDCTATDT
jgi:hypothetical protein